ncbi:copper resistance CopC family protein [Phycicoccus flavus]|uniref:copper resistance CopC family protein n=1 Tax=Phycicoccus flavus TaxID=2502783 RepID=UPI000FEBD0BC|nr:copper resistance CopC family protein [Phycicoccus flavus]NHA67508.1 copper resistance protein CopC [Phycicoccus flavus]
MFSRRTTAVITALLVALVTVALVVSAVPVFAHPAAALPAHAQLTGTAPRDGSTVRTAQEVRLTFSEDVNPRFLQVTVEGPDGDETDGDATTDGGQVRQALVDDLPAGEHTVTYRVVSVDGHPVSGTFSFSTTATPRSASPTASPSTSADPTATPTPTGPSAEPSPATAPTAEVQGSSWTLPLALVGLVAVVLVAVVLLARRRVRGGDGPPPDSP